MWLTYRDVLLGLCLIFRNCLYLLYRYYFALLDWLFEYTGRQLREMRQQQAWAERQRVKAALARPGQPATKCKTVLAPLQKDQLNAHMDSFCEVISNGLRLVLEDDVTPRFAAAETPDGEWNLLTRNLSQRFMQLNWQLRLLWFLGLLFRYLLLLPLRGLVCGSSMLALTICALLLTHLPDGSWKQELVSRAVVKCFRLMACSMSIVRRVHHPEHQPHMGISVCNHTSPLDVLVLMCDNYYALTGQRHTGIMGLIQRCLTRLSQPVWFERQILAERQALGKVLRVHGRDHTEPPILLFPEGTCVNNTAVMQFKKGGFAVSKEVYPVAVRYDSRFGEFFWDSTRYSMMRHVIMLMTSWCILCDIWYMPALRRQPKETPIEFSNRVKAAIAAQAGIKDLPWDGNLKRWSPARDW